MLRLVLLLLLLSCTSTPLSWSSTRTGPLRNPWDYPNLGLKPRQLEIRPASSALKSSMAGAFGVGPGCRMTNVLIAEDTPKVYIPKLYTVVEEPPIVCPSVTGDTIFAMAPDGLDIYTMGYPALTVWNTTKIQLVYLGEYSNPYTVLPDYCSYLLQPSMFSQTACVMPEECGKTVNRIVTKTSWWNTQTTLCVGTGIGLDYTPGYSQLKDSGVVRIYEWAVPEEFIITWEMVPFDTYIMYDGYDYYHVPSNIIKWSYTIVNGAATPPNNWFDTNLLCYNRFTEQRMTQYPPIKIGPSLYNTFVDQTGYRTNYSIAWAAYPLPQYVQIISRHSNNKTLPTVPTRMFTVFKNAGVCVGGHPNFYFLPYECEAREEEECRLPTTYYDNSWSHTLIALIATALQAIGLKIGQSVLAILRFVVGYLLQLLLTTHIVLWFPLYYHTRDIAITVMATAAIVTISYAITHPPGLTGL